MAIWISDCVIRLSVLKGMHFRGMYVHKELWHLGWFPSFEIICWNLMFPYLRAFLHDGASLLCLPSVRLITPCHLPSLRLSSGCVFVKGCQISQCTYDLHSVLSLEKKRSTCSGCLRVAASCILPVPRAWFLDLNSLLSSYFSLLMSPSLTV